MVKASTISPSLMSLNFSMVARHGGIGGVHAVALGKLVNDLELQLALVVVIAGLIALERGIDLRDEEAIVLHGIDEEEVLFHTLHGRAALGAEERIEVVVAALNGALEDGRTDSTGRHGWSCSRSQCRSTRSAARAGGSRSSPAG